MMIRINLLPHREEKRKRSRQHFMVMAGVAAGIGVAIIAAVHVFYAGSIDQQVGRNDYLKKSIASLEKEIDQIKTLRDEIAQLLSRKKAIEDLQGNRAQTVHLLDQLVRQMPEGVYLKSVSQKGPNVKLIGYAQSNARVSTLMKNIDSSPWLQRPTLVEIKTTTLDKKRVSEFTLDLALKPPVAAKKDEPKAKPPAKDAGKDAAKKG